MTQIAIVIPTHDRPTLLSSAIESALSAAKDPQVIVVDNSASATAADVCRRYSRIIYVRLDNNNGPASARNAGIALTKAEYISFLDDDDVLLPEALDRLLVSLTTSPTAALSYGQIHLGDQHCKLSGNIFPTHMPEGDVFWQLIESNFIMIHSALVRRSVIEQANYFDSSVWYNEDWDLWVRIAERWPISALCEPVGIVRLNSPDRLSQRRKAMYQSVLSLQRRWLDLPRARGSAKRRRKLLGQLRRRAAKYYIKEAVTSFASPFLSRKS